MNIKLLKMRSFTCHIADPNILKTIKASEKEVKSLRDVKNKIANALKLKTSQFSISNPPEDKKLSSVINNYQFEVTIENRCTDINFVLPNKKEVTIPDSFRMTVMQVLEYIETACSVYYSREIILKKNLHLMIDNKDISTSPYPFFALQPDTKVELKLFGKVINLEYAGKEIVLTDNEYLSTAKDTIKRAFNDQTSYHLITIRNEPSGVALKGRDKLKSAEKYEIEMKCQFIFCQASRHSNQTNIHLDYSAKVSDAQEYMSQIFNEGSFKPENIILFDKENNEIEDREKVLREIQGVKDPFYFRVVKNEEPPVVEEESIHVSEEHKAEEAAFAEEEERENKGILEQLADAVQENLEKKEEPEIQEEEEVKEDDKEETEPKEEVKEEPHE